MPHPSLSVPFHTRLWVPQWNISLHSIIIMNGLCSVSVSLMEFTESLLLLSFLLLHRRAANPIHFHSYPSNPRFSSVPSIFINLPAWSILGFIRFGHSGRNLYFFKTHLTSSTNLFLSWNIYTIHIFLVTQKSEWTYTVHNMIFSCNLKVKSFFWSDVYKHLTAVFVLLAI